VKRQRLFRKYVVVLVLLVSGALLTSGIVQLVFNYQENQAALVAVQREKAAGAAGRIEAFVEEIQRVMAGAVATPATTGALLIEQQRTDLLRLLRQAPAILEVSILDGSGREQLRISRLALDVVSSQADRSHEAEFVATRDTETYFGPVYFRDESEPYMTLATRDPRTEGAVLVAEVNLKFIWDVVTALKVGTAGYAYVVDRDGALIAHPDISLVLRRPDLSRLPQVQAIAGHALAPALATNLQGEQVLTARAAVDPPGWSVLVEQPLDEAFAPLYASLLRTALLLVVGLILAIVVSLFLARRMVTPIHALQRGAAQIGRGALDQRIDVRTGDELDMLAETFNRMSEQLRESYSSLERKVDERTQALADAMRALESKTRELEVASRHKSEFLANMSHELRTPLNAIIGFSDVLVEGMAGDLNGEQREFVGDILSSGHHLLSLINDILDLSKIEAGRMDLEIDRFCLREALENGLTMVRERAHRHRIALHLDVDPRVEWMVGDQRKIKQVVFNLLSNATKFTPDGGRVDVCARPVGEAVEIAVSDTGLGIAPEDIERIFGEFEQVRVADVVHEGTGLGLALARRFVELHGGELRVSSEPGRGSTFTLSVPYRRM
jgi:signal transduction histidine kinase